VYRTCECREKSASPQLLEMLMIESDWFAGARMPYSGRENPKAGDTVRHPSRGIGTVFELDLQADKSAKQEDVKNEKVRVKFDDGTSETVLARELSLVQRASE
jgi:hypothetical protein